jgi:lipoteichoic acid synthase
LILRISKSSWQGLLLASPGVFIALSAFRAWRIEHNIGVYSGCRGCFWQASLGHDAWLLAAMLGLIGVGCIARSRWLRGLVRLVAALILLVYAADIATDVLLSQRLYLADVVRFASHAGDDSSVLRDALASPAGMLRGCIGLLVVVIALGICFPANRCPRTALAFLCMALASLIFAGFEAAHPLRYMNALVVDNVVEANLPQGRVTDFSAPFIARQRAIADALPQHCAVTPVSGGGGSVIVLMVESLSAWHSQLLDGTHDWTPRLDAIARDNHYFRNFYANGFTTSTGAISTITGKVPFVPPGKTWFDFSDYADAQDSLPGIAHRSGRDAAFFTTEDVSFLNLGTWLHRIGFDTVDSSSDPFYLTARRAQFGGAEDAALYARFLKWMDGRASGQSFISVLTTISSHPPFVDPRTSRIDPKGTLRYVDAEIGRFYDALRQRGFFDHGILLVLGDHRTMTPLHADEFRVHGERAFARIPLVVAGAVDMPAVVVGAFQQTDIAASIASWLGLPACNGPFGGLFLRAHPQPAQYVVHVRGDDRNRVDVYSGAGSVDGFRLEGDRSAWIDKRPENADAVAAWIDWQRRQAQLRAGSPQTPPSLAHRVGRRQPINAPAPANVPAR